MVKSTHLLAFLDDALPEVFPTTGKILERVSDYLLNGLLCPVNVVGGDGATAKDDTYALSFRSRPRNCMRTSKGSIWIVVVCSNPTYMASCQRCKQSTNGPQAFLLTCRGCSKTWHHSKS